MEHRGPNEHPRKVSTGCAAPGLLDDIHGLVFRAATKPLRDDLIDTGMQRLVQDLDELPTLWAG